MPESTMLDWPEKIRQRYENYLKTSFYFSDPQLRRSFEDALQNEGALLTGPFPEHGFEFKTTKDARTLAEDCFHDQSEELRPALLSNPLYVHQARAINSVHGEDRNIVVATGTASGKTESFLYPILFELYRQYVDGNLEEPGVRALVLYPMNALANDQRERLGKICRDLRDAGSQFVPTFGQYTGETPENSRDQYRNAREKLEQRLDPAELILREEMRATPPHILLTNYSMLEYLLIRPHDSPLFDDGKGKHWQFIVLDEAHQYRGAKGMEVGMLVRRLKQRLRGGGRQLPFRCIATSATITTGSDVEDREAVAQFAQELFGEPFSQEDVIFSDFEEERASKPRRYHAFLRALEGAFLIHRAGEDHVILNRKLDEEGSRPLEIALCRECGQHYYVGRENNGKLLEAIRDPSHSQFGVQFYIPAEEGENWLCRTCGSLDATSLSCGCDAGISVQLCESDPKHPDQLKKCENCGYQRGGIGDPVQEIVHGSDGPNAVIATALHELLPTERRRVLAFADSRQEAAFFAWYVEDSYQKLRDRNLILRAIRGQSHHSDTGVSIDDLRNLLLSEWDESDLLSISDTPETKRRNVMQSILREVITDERRLSLSGVGLISWTLLLPPSFQIPEVMYQSPWSFTKDEAEEFIVFALDELRPRRAVDLPKGVEIPNWGDISDWPQRSCCIGAPGNRRNVFTWGGAQSSIVNHFLRRILADMGVAGTEAREASVDLMKAIWHALREVTQEPILVRGSLNGTFRLNPSWLRVKEVQSDELWECNTCARLTTYNIRGICPRNRCSGILNRSDHTRLAENHYRILYTSENLPPSLSAVEHTAQIDSNQARDRQNQFKNGDIHLLSSSTTFEIGVDLGDLDVVFLRNVPPESFNYVQRTGRAGRREQNPGLALTYCRRNPHDLYHYENPEKRILNGQIRPPRLYMTNEKIIRRHMTATALSAYFREFKSRFINVANFVGDWNTPSAAISLSDFCTTTNSVEQSLLDIVPGEMHDATGLNDGSWISSITGPESRLARVETEVCHDYVELQNLRTALFEEGKDNLLPRIRNRAKTIADEPTLNFLSRKAVIPKYGFPVDVVELETHTADGHSAGVSLQRDLSQAIAEYAPGGKVVANKLEWESYGVKSVPGKEWPIRYYRYDDQHNFTQWNEGDESLPSGSPRKYLIPEFGFITPFFEQPKSPNSRGRRLYTTRPFFQGFGGGADPEIKEIGQITVSRAQTGTLVILCEGKEQNQFCICRSCGAHVASPTANHKTPFGKDCHGTWERFSLGHELVTDVVRIQFPAISKQWEAYSLGYAVMLGAAEILNVPDTDLNVTITRGKRQDEMAIVLYDNVPGGAGLVIQIEREDSFIEMIQSARARVEGSCGCDSSCYGCIRSYRNQFAHPHLSRLSAHEALDVALAT